jgi:hypothetical protein
LQAFELREPALQLCAEVPLQRAVGYALARHDGPELILRMRIVLLGGQ